VFQIVKLPDQIIIVAANNSSARTLSRCVTTEATLVAKFVEFLLEELSVILFVLVVSMLTLFLS